MPYLVYGGAKLNPDEAPSADAVGIPDSLVILEFLADLYPNAGLLPADLALRAKARLFAHAVEPKFIPAFVGFLFMGMPHAALLAVVDTIASRVISPARCASKETSVRMRWRPTLSCSDRILSCANKF